MSQCSNCKIEILDDTNVCPLCHCVLEKKKDALPCANGYPDVKKTYDKLTFSLRVYTFLALVIELLLVIINYKTGTEYWWSTITGGAFAFAYLTMRFTIINNSGYKTKIVLQTLFAVVYVLVIDACLGYRGWSMNYVLPAAIIAVDIGIVILMIVNYRNWQSYILFQMFMVICSVAPIILYGVHIVTRPFLGFIAIGFSLCVFLGTLIVGDAKARSELRRRFYI
ncbi:MAG: DUF6320 domain-containing protein [Lachnospiraceae bacterium]